MVEKSSTQSRARRELDFDKVSKLLAYDPESGRITWRVSRSGNLGAGSEAGAICKRHGYRNIHIHHVTVRAHRLAWLLMTGSFPDGDIDHINRDRADNRWSNLRIASDRQNKINSVMPRPANPDLLPAVHHSANGKRYRARISVMGKKRWLGTFDTQEQAYSAYVSALGHDAKFAPMEVNHGA